jgi:hypothetical protein
MQEGSPTSPPPHTATRRVRPLPPPLLGIPHTFLGGRCGAWHRTESPHCTRTLVSGARIKRSTRSPCFFFCPDGGGDGRHDRDKIRNFTEAPTTLCPRTVRGRTLGYEPCIFFCFCSFSFFLDGVTRRLDILVRECRKSTRWSEHGVNAGEKEARDVCFQPQEDGYFDGVTGQAVVPVEDILRTCVWGGCWSAREWRKVAECYIRRNSSIIGRYLALMARRQGGSSLRPLILLL